MILSQSDAEVGVAKSELRGRHRAALEALAADAAGWRERQSRLLGHVRAALKGAGGVWGAYRALPGEADIVAALPVQAGIEWAYPLVAGDHLEFRIPESGEGSYAPGRWGVFEPLPEKSRPIPTKELAGFLIPGLAFDRTGLRLGRGRGFYDRCLMGANGFRLGVAFAVQLAVKPLPAEDHDACMDAVVTEDGLIWSGARRI